MTDKIYLDHNATTPVTADVLEAMLSVYRSGVANPSSIHYAGQEARGLLTEAREKIARQLVMKPREIVFTSGGTEALNMLVRGALIQYQPKHVISSNVEHNAVYRCLEGREGVTQLAPAGHGAVTVQQVEAALTPQTGLIVLMAVNNETGVKTDLAAIAALAQAHQIPLIVDGVAWVGKEPVTIPEGVAAMAFSAHKFHGPQGVGGAVVRQHFKLPPLILGGSQERGARGGTENLAGIVGMATALEAVSEEVSQRVQGLRDLLEQLVINGLDNVSINGDGDRICNTTNLAFGGVSGEGLLMSLDLAGVAASHGAACSAGALEPSRVLLNMGLGRERAASSLRFSLACTTTEEEVRRAAQIIIDTVRRLRPLIVT